MLKFTQAIVNLGKTFFFVQYRLDQNSKIYPARVTPAFHLTPTYGTFKIFEICTGNFGKANFYFLIKINQDSSMKLKNEISDF